MGTIKDIDRLQPELAKRTRAFSRTEKARHRGNRPETDRTVDTQTAYYAQGRKPLEDVNALRKKQGCTFNGSGK